MITVLLSYCFMYDKVMFKYTTIHSFLSKIECEKIINVFNNNFQFQKGCVTKEAIIDLKRRDSNVSFGTFDMFPMIKERLHTKLREEVKIKGFELNFENQQIQFTEYKKNGHYDWHVDASDEGLLSDRFCSIVIQLNNGYEGGELLLKDYNEELKEEFDVTFEKGLGNLFVFLSKTRHKVAPVTMGNRYSLVSWFSLTPIKEYKKTLI